MINGQKAFEKLSAMTEEERKQCGFVWMVDKMTLGQMKEHVHNQICNNYDFNEDEEDEMEVVEKAEKLTPDEIAHAIDAAELDDELYEQLWDVFCDSLWDAVDCKLPPRDMN